MTDRTFQQHAQGYGSTPCQVVCEIDGNTVFNGTVATLDQPVPSLPNLEISIDNVAWTWSQDAAFSGTKSLSIAVTGSTLLLASTFADNPVGNAVGVFGTFYAIEIDGRTYFDPLTDEAIDGIPQSGPYNSELEGQWWWRIPAGSTFTATLHVSEPSVP